MCEAQYIFNQTARERKRSGRWAAAKKNGSKSKRCTMPSDYLSAAQKRKLNGEVKMYDISRPMSWGMFREMPFDLQKEYMTKLANMGAGREDVSRMMETSKTALSQYLNKHHKGMNYFASRKSKNRIPFLEWWDNALGPKTTAAAKKESTENAIKSENAQKATMTKASFIYEGTLQMAFENVVNLCGGDRKYRVTISLEPME